MTFCNTGSEAVMAAMRVARTVTGRERVVVFDDDYHGQFDEVLVRAERRHGPARAAGGAGHPAESIANMIVLPYGEPRSLDWIEANGRDIAAVLVEPVQSRHPELRPVEFLQRAARDHATRAGAALVFDEIVTGFRVHPGGMQAVFGITRRPRDLRQGRGRRHADRHPGRQGASSWMRWTAAPGATATTPCPRRPPPSSPARSCAIPWRSPPPRPCCSISRPKGLQLQERLAGRMDGLVDVPQPRPRTAGPGDARRGLFSWFYINFAAEGPLGRAVLAADATARHPRPGRLSLLPHHRAQRRRHRGDRERLPQRRSMRSRPAASSGAERRASGPTRRRRTGCSASAPLTEPQLEILTAAQMGEDASCTFNELVSIALDGALDPAALESRAERRDRPA